MSASPSSKPTPDSSWGASDALLLEGLNDLDEMFVNPVEHRSVTQTPTGSNAASEETIRVGNYDFSPEVSESGAPLTGFRSAREWRAAKEKVAAEQRSAARREGNTQMLGLPPQSERPTVDPYRPPRPISPEAKAEPMTPPAVEPTTPPQALKEAATAIVKRPSAESSPAAPPRPVKKPETAPKPEAKRRTPIRPRKESATRPGAPAEDIAVSARAKQHPKLPEGHAHTGKDGRLVSPQMDSPMVRRRRTTSSFFPAVFTAFLLTSLIWAAGLYAFWKAVGDEWLTQRVQEEATPLRAGLKDELQTGRAQLTNETRTVEQSVLELRNRFEVYVRMSALEAALYSDNSRSRFDDLLDCAQDLPSGSPEEVYFQNTKDRIEAAYTKRLAQHKGLDVRRLFPTLNVTRESSIGKTTLMNFIANSEAAGWDRARAAYLLRRFKDDDQVIAHLFQTCRDDEDLQVVLASWDSLVAVTGYEPGSQGFDLDDFARWLSRS